MGAGQAVEQARPSGAPWCAAGLGEASLNQMGVPASQGCGDDGGGRVAGQPHEDLQDAFDLGVGGQVQYRGDHVASAVVLLVQDAGDQCLTDPVGAQRVPPVGPLVQATQPVVGQAPHRGLRVTGQVRQEVEQSGCLGVVAGAGQGCQCNACASCR